jgi:hypothetical protein
MTDIIRNTIDKFRAGYVFTVGEIPTTATNPALVSMVLGNMVRKGQIRKLSKGRFYKPQIGKLGELPPSDYEVVMDLLVKNGRLIGYITGYSAFNELGLTTQITFALQIGYNDVKRALKRGIYRVSFVKQRNAITKENIPLLKLLDCLRYFKNIPDSTPDDTCRKLMHLLNQLDDNQRNKIKKLALKYSPQAIALLGAMLETLNSQEDTNVLFKKLNPLTSYKLSISKEILPTQKKWRIK